ncbi:hypothetical protein NIIDMKKI_27690 [Mycobacterium kansasii]|uniref:Uncharacterized protein n=1 Tax=Mycobacterium kansasii TaxID=1768 RepID=A0A7G1IB79_MYCKA|nr:hypothetical protein NIIDMKKI_27690 [Mycobacterium kansasii]
MRGLGDQDVITVDTVGFEPVTVIGEVGAGRADQRHVTAQHADGEGHIPGDAAAVHHQVVD